jgi:hypothetical protein
MLSVPRLHVMNETRKIIQEIYVLLLKEKLNGVHVQVSNTATLLMLIEFMHDRW